MALEGGELFLILSIRGETPTVPRFAAGRLPPPSVGATIPPSPEERGSQSGRRAVFLSADRPRPSPGNSEATDARLSSRSAASVPFPDRDLRSVKCVRTPSALRF